MFKKLYNATEDAIKSAKQPLVAKKVKRGFESASDSLEDKKIALTETIENLRQKVANGETELIKQLCENKLELSDLDELIVAIEAERDLFFPKEEN